MSMTVMLIADASMAQSPFDSILDSIKYNNKTIRLKAKELEERRLNLKSEMNLSNPKVDYDYLKGSPSTAGNQTDLTINQPFDFPTAYIKRKQLLEEQNTEAELALLLVKQEVLLDAKMLLLELIFRNKIQDILLARMKNAQNYLSAYELKFTSGDANILDLNKAKLEMIDVNTKVELNSSEILQLKQKLIELNGGENLNFQLFTYPERVDVPEVEALELEIESQDPIRKLLEQQRVISSKNIEFSKSMALPKIETGYHYQAILGQTFQGVHVGFTIPLWENRNKIKSMQAHLIATESKLDEHKIEHSAEIKQLHEKQRSLKSILAQYEQLLEPEEYSRLLNQAFEFGEISSINYYMEIAYNYTTVYNYLLTEMEYHQAIARLYRFQLN